MASRRCFANNIIDDVYQDEKSSLDNINNALCSEPFLKNTYKDRDEYGS